MKRKKYSKELKTKVALAAIKGNQTANEIILIGNPGTGKTWLSKCIAYAATQNGVKTLFTTAMDMINQLVAAENDHTMLKKLQFYQSQELLVCDEIGVPSAGQTGIKPVFPGHQRPAWKKVYHHNDQPVMRCTA